MTPHAFEAPDRSETKPDEREFKERIEAGYAADGVTVENVERTLAAIKTDNARGPYSRKENHETCFYLNSSDPLDVLYRKIDATGERVVTVAGSGEFAQTLMAKGAREVTIFDVSIPAALYNELRLVGLRRLDFDAYRAMFDAWKKEGGATLFDADRYRRLRDGLSREAQAYFDALTQEENADLFGYDDMGRPLRMNGFARSRKTENGAQEDAHYPSLIGDVITTAEEYSALQARAIRTPVSIRVKDARSMAAEAGGADTAYLSNIGYRPEVSLDIARRFLGSGTRRVLFTTSLNRATWGVEAPIVHFIDAEGGIHSPTDFEERKRLLAQGARRLPSLDGKPLLPGTEFPHHGLTMRYVDSTPGALYGVLMEARKEKDDPTP